MIEVEEHGIPIREVPAAVTDALTGRMPDFETKVEAIYQGENGQPGVSYGFEVPDADGRVIEVYFSSPTARPS